MSFFRICNVISSSHDTGKACVGPKPQHKAATVGSWSLFLLIMARVSCGACHAMREYQSKGLAVLAVLLLLGTGVPLHPVFSAPTKSATGRASTSGSKSSAVPPPAAAQQPETPIEHNNRGVELGNKGLWLEAVHEHELAVEADPNNKEFRTNLSAAQLRYGDVLAAKHDYSGAIKQYRGALYADENNLSAEHNLDECLRRLGKNPDDVKAHVAMGEDAETSGDYETAIVEYRRCTKISDDGSYYARLGMVYRKAGKDVQAFNELKTAVTRPWSVESRQDKAFGLSSVHRMLGDILKQYAYIARKDGRQTTALKRLVNAGIEYRRAVTLNPGDLDAVQSLVEVSREAVAINPCFDNELTLAGAYQLSGDMEHARMEYDKCYRLDPNSSVLSAARRSFYGAVVRSPTVPPDFLQSTMGKIEAQLKKTPNDAELLYLYGRGYEAQGNTAQALAYYQKASAINPYVNPDLAQGLSRLGQGTPALAAPLGAAPQSTGASGTGYAGATYTGGRVAAEGSLKEASGEPLPILRTTAGSFSSGGSVLQRLPDPTSSLQAVTSGSTYSQFENMIVSGQTEQAFSVLTAYVKAHPQDGHAWLLLGNVSEKKGDLNGAEVAYRQAKNLNDPAADEALRQIDASRVQPLLQEADRYMADRNWVGASASLHDALTLAPEMPLVHRKLSEVLKQMGDTKESSRELKKAQELEKK